jgi:WD40 repeat protein
MLKLMIALIGFLLVTLSPVAAQDSALPELEVITAENAGRIEQLGMLGRGRMRELAYSPDGEILAIASSVGVWLYNPDDLNAEPRFLEGHTAPVTAIAFSPDGRYLASGSDDFMVRIWDVATGDEIANLRAGYIDVVTDVAFTPDGRYLVTAGNDSRLRLYDTQTWEQLKQFVGGNLLAFSSDGSLLATTRVRTNEIHVLRMEDLLEPVMNFTGKRPNIGRSDAPSG